MYLFIPFFWDSSTGQTGWWNFTRDSSLDVKSREDVPFVVIKLKFNIRPLFIFQNRQFWPKRDSFFDRKRLTMRVLKSKLPLIIIVAP